MAEDKKLTPEQAAERLAAVLQDHGIVEKLGGTPWEKQRKEDDDNIVHRIQAIYILCSELSAYWDHTGTNMIDGYPKSLPSWDEFVSELAGWYEAQQKLRWHDHGR